MMKIIWLDQAINDLESVRHYIAQDNPLAAQQVALRIISAVEMLSNHPAMGRAGRVYDTRELVVSDAPYVIPYRVRNGSVEILRIFHTAIRWPDKF